jgi:hypothetical protein
VQPVAEIKLKLEKKFKKLYLNLIIKIHSNNKKNFHKPQNDFKKNLFKINLKIET